MRRKELATELEQQGITTSRMTALEIQDRKFTHFRVAMILAKRCSTLHILHQIDRLHIHIIIMCVIIYMSIIGIRYTYFNVIFHTKRHAGIERMNCLFLQPLPTCRDVCAKQRLTCLTFTQRLGASCRMAVW